MNSANPDNAMISCFAIDDEPLALQQICNYIEKTPFLRLIGSAKDAFAAMEELAGTDVDLLFVDINMPGLSGMDFVKTLDGNHMVIFTTAYSEYAVEGFRVDAVDYLLKPIGYPDFLKAANKALSFHRAKRFVPETPAESDDYLFVKSEYRVVRVSFRDITYIEGMREYVRIHFFEGKPVMSLMSLKNLEERLPRSHFMRVHRSFIVNLDAIRVVERNRIVFGKDVYIPVGEQYRDAFQQFMERKFL